MMIERFADPQGGFFDTSDDHERLITRPKNVQDNATPSGSAMAATALFRLSGLTGDGRYAEAAESGMNLISGFADKHPTAFGQWLNAMDYCLGDPLEVAIVGDPASRGFARVAGRCIRGFSPRRRRGGGRRGRYFPGPAAKPAAAYRRAGHGLRMPELCLQSPGHPRRRPSEPALEGPAIPGFRPRNGPDRRGRRSLER